MRRVGIITIQQVDNYGAELQAYALFKKLSNEGHKVQIINYLYVKHPDHKEEKESAPFALFSLKDKIKWKIFRVAQLLMPYYKRRTFINRKSKFDDFYKNICYSDTFKSISSLYNSNLDYDVYIVGSDQVWNPSTMTNLDPFFLKFAPKSATKLSYASSFGVTAIPEYLHEKYRVGLQNIDVLSSRELEGVNLIDKIAGKEAEHVLDPTLLLSKTEWKDLAKPYVSNTSVGIEAPYIFIYALEKSDYIINLANKIKEMTGWNIVKINTRHIGLSEKRVDYDIFDAGPSEFVSLILNANFVLTNSFHGTVFSANFEIPFFTILSNKKKNNSRQIGILESLNLKSRLILEGTEYKELPDIHFSFSESSQKLQEDRLRSIAYLQKAINIKNTDISV
jgi:hypothetical protein